MSWKLWIVGHFPYYNAIPCIMSPLTDWTSLIVSKATLIVTILWSSRTITPLYFQDRDVSVNQHASNTWPYGGRSRPSNAWNSHRAQWLRPLCNRIRPCYWSTVTTACVPSLVPWAPSRLSNDGRRSCPCAVTRSTPEMDGRELSEFIRFNPETSHIPIIMVTSEASDSMHMLNIQQTGVNALCDKPFEPTEVRAMLAALLGEWLLA